MNIWADHLSGGWRALPYPHENPIWLASSVVWDTGASLRWLCVCAGEQMVDSGKELEQPPSNPLPAHFCTQCLLPSFWNSTGRSHLWWLCCQLYSITTSRSSHHQFSIFQKFLLLLDNAPTPSDCPQPPGFYFYFCICSIISVGFGEEEEGYTVVCP